MVKQRHLHHMNERDNALPGVCHTTLGPVKLTSQLPTTAGSDGLCAVGSTLSDGLQVVLPDSSAMAKDVAACDNPLSEFGKKEHPPEYAYAEYVCIVVGAICS